MKRFATILLSLFLVAFCAQLTAQDWIRTGTGLGVEKIRLAVPDFKAANDADSKRLTTAFSVTLWNDLQAAGIPPGPFFGKILAALLKIVVDNPLANSRDFLLLEARRLFEAIGDRGPSSQGTTSQS